MKMKDLLILVKVWLMSRISQRIFHFNSILALRDEIDREFAKALKGGKKKRKKQDGEDLESSMDEELSNLRERMRNASEEDAVANGERRAAVAKLKMLGEVTTMLTKYVIYPLQI